VYERTPSALRAARRGGGLVGGGTAAAGLAPGSGIRLLLPARAPFDGAGLLDFLGVRAVAGVESYGPDGYERTLRLPHGSASLHLSLAGTPAAPMVACVARLDSLADLAPLVSRVRRLFDLDADAQAIDRALADDPALADSVRRTPGIRVPGSLDAEETLFRALLGQQVSVASARTALGRLSAALGEPVSGSGGNDPEAAPFLLFPTAARIAEHGREVLRGPAARITAIVGVAEALASGNLVLDVGESRDELQARLTALPGIGPWTAGYVAMRVLGSPDILLTSDLALRQGADRLGLPAKAADLARHGARWAPWRSYAGMHLWRAAGAPRPDPDSPPRSAGAADDTGMGVAPLL
jgi:AraC family transcriptional regulator of adaptative response / DNA-3-methyladenine glycosylase II